MNDGKCLVEDCETKAFCKEYCQQHYDLLRRRNTVKRLRSKYDLDKYEIIDNIKDTRPGHRGLLAINIINDIKYKARKRNKLWELTHGEAFKLITSSCNYCNFKPSWPENRVGIDRVNNSIGYELSNCVPCCSTCNSAKGELSTQEFLNWIKRIYNNFILKGN